jgi:hypothetical protein
MVPNQIQLFENEVVLKAIDSAEYADVRTMGNHMAYKWQHK